MQVELLWFQCKNKQCDFIPVKSKKDKVKQWALGRSLRQSARPRIFMKYAQGEMVYRDSYMLFRCKYGDILIYDRLNEMDVNSYIFPIIGEEYCNQCKEKLHNEGLLFQ